MKTTAFFIFLIIFSMRLLAQNDVNQLPKPRPYYADKSEGEISIGEIKANDSIKVCIKGVESIKSIYRVSKFTMVFIPVKGNAQRLTSKNSKLTIQMRSLVNFAAKGDIIQFNDIYATYPGSDEIRLPEVISLTVK